MKKPGSKKGAEKAPSKAKQMATNLIGVFNGNILTREDVLKHLPFVLFLTVLALVYIANGYMAESNIRSINRLENELKELRSEDITIKSDLMYQSKQSQVAKILAEKEMGLKESTTPPQKIVVTPSELKP